MRTFLEKKEGKSR